MNSIGEKEDRPYHIQKAISQRHVFCSQELPSDLTSKSKQRHSLFSDAVRATESIGRKKNSVIIPDKKSQLLHVVQKRNVYGVKQKWQMLKEIGRGATGMVYKVRDIKTGEIYVAKKLHPIKNELGNFNQERVKSLKVRVLEIMILIPSRKSSRCCSQPNKKTSLNSRISN